MNSGTVTAPPYSSSSVHDPDNPIYDIQIDNWEETLELFRFERDQTVINEQRDYNNRKYKEENGDCAMWNRYVAFGFHQFDDCNSFADKWKQADTSDIPTEKYKIIWNEYTTYLLQNEEPTNSQLYIWTHNLVLPYLSRHEPDYHLASVYAIEDNIQQQLPREITNPLQTTWTEIGLKKKRTPPTSPNHTRPTTPTTTNTTFDQQNNNNPQLTRLSPQNIRRRKTTTFPINNNSSPKSVHPSNPTNELNKTTPQTKNTGNHNQKSDNSYSTNNEIPQPNQQQPATNAYKTKRPTREENTTKDAHEHRSHSGMSTYSTLNTKNLPFVPINDGTVRMTIKWKPTSDNFYDFSENSELWETEAIPSSKNYSTSKQFSNPLSFHGHRPQLTIQRNSLKLLTKEVFHNSDPRGLQNWNRVSNLFSVFESA